MSQEHLDTDKSETVKESSQVNKPEAVKESSQVNENEMASPAQKSSWKSKLGSRRVLTLAAIGLLGLGVLARAGGYKLAHQADRWEDAVENRIDGQPVVRSSYETAVQSVETKVDMASAASAVLKEVDSGYISEIDLEARGQSPFYEVTVRDGQKESTYQVDATSGDILASETDYETDRDAEDTTEPKADMTTLLKAVSSKYKDAQILSVSIEETSSGQIVYQVETLKDGTQTQSQFSADDAKFISDVTHQADNDDWDD